MEYTHKEVKNALEETEQEYNKIKNKYPGTN